MGGFSCLARPTRVYSNGLPQPAAMCCEVHCAHLGVQISSVSFVSNAQLLRENRSTEGALWLAGLWQKNGLGYMSIVVGLISGLEQRVPGSSTATV